MTWQWLHPSEIIRSSKCCVARQWSSFQQNSGNERALEAEDAHGKTAIIVNHRIAPTGIPVKSIYSAANDHWISFHNSNSALSSNVEKLIADLPRMSFDKKYASSQHEVSSGDDLWLLIGLAITWRDYWTLFVSTQKQPSRQDYSVFVVNKLRRVLFKLTALRHDIPAIRQHGQEYTRRYEACFYVWRGNGNRGINKSPIQFIDSTK